MTTEAIPNENADKDAIFIDAYNMMYRAYHVSKNDTRKSQDGLPIGTISTLMAMSFKTLKYFTNVTYGTAVFDGGGVNFRELINPSYKANRSQMPEDLRVVIPMVKEMFEIIGCPVVQAHDVEADDVLGTLAQRAGVKGFNSVIISADKDFRQLVTENVFVLDTMGGVIYDEAAVVQKMGVVPSQVVDWLALVGDSSDNIAGVSGVGEKTATKLLTQYGDIAGIINNVETVGGKIGLELKKAVDSGQLLQSKLLATIKTDVEVSMKKKDVLWRGVDEDRMEHFCKKLQIHNPLTPRVASSYKPK